MLLSNNTDAIKIIIKSDRFFVAKGQFFRRFFKQKHVKCIVGYEVSSALKEVHLEVKTSTKGTLGL